MSVSAMIHFFPISTASEADTPFGRELRRLGVKHRFIGFPVDMRYRTGAGLLFRVYPRLLAANIRAAIHSLILSKDKPEVLVVSTDVQALVLGVFNIICSTHARVVFQTLIMSPKKSRFRRFLQQFLYTIVLRFTDIAICHSRVEVESYRARFPKAKCRFCFIPYGTTVAKRAELIAAATSDRHRSFGGRAKIASAGRSGRDYRTLIEAIRGLPCEVIIVCDVSGPVRDLTNEDQLKIVTGLYNEDYLRILAEADVIVIPLAADDVSAGQMVLLQSFALQKPVIISRTSTTVDYMIDGEEGIMVGIGRTDELRRSVERLLGSELLRQELGKRGADRFDKDFTTEVYVQRLLATIAENGEEKRI